VSLTLTEAAANKAMGIMAEEKLTPENSYIRVEIFGGGCSGFNYNLFIDDKPVNEEVDEVFETFGVRVVTNTICMTYVDGTEIDYIEKMYGGGFKFNNPNSTGNCGCGQSFSI